MGTRLRFERRPKLRRWLVLEAGKGAGWRKHIKAQRGSDLSITASCRRHGLPEHGFYWCRRELAGRDVQRPAFVPVTMVPQPPVHCAEGQIEILASHDAQEQVGQSLFAGGGIHHLYTAQGLSHPGGAALLARVVCLSMKATTSSGRFRDTITGNPIALNVPSRVCRDRTELLENLEKKKDHALGFLEFMNASFCHEITSVPRSIASFLMSSL